MQAHDHENDNRHAEGNSVQPPQACRKSTSNMHGHHNVRSGSHGYSTLDELLVHPSSFRSSIIEFSRQEVNDANLNESGYDHSTEQTSLLSKDNGRSHPHSDTPKKNHHKSHKHVKANGQTANDAHGHSHGDLNMRGVFLHILGDALGNVGVIATALFIWLTDFRWRHYADPIVSLVITVIILVSAIPLCKAASRILLQAVPDNLSIDKIKDDIAGLENIVSCHHLHVWQLSDTKLVASLHVQVDFDFKDEGSARYMSLARQIRKCLHEYGIHSSTIQPEFCLDVTHDHSAVGSEDEATKVKVPGDKDESDACLLECPDSCGTARQCCESGQKGCKGSNSP
jgi:zinc transporter 1